MAEIPAVDGTRQTRDRKVNFAEMSEMSSGIVERLGIAEISGRFFEQYHAVLGAALDEAPRYFKERRHPGRHLEFQLPQHRDCLILAPDGSKRERADVGRHACDFGYTLVIAPQEPSVYDARDDLRVKATGTLVCRN